MKTFLVVFAVIASVNAINPVLDGETAGAHALEDIGAPAKYVEKMKVSFGKLRKAYCSPAVVDDKKIEAASKCDPTTNFDIAHKCMDKVFKAKKLQTWNEKRKAECLGGAALEDIDHEVKDCTAEQVKAQNFKVPEPIAPESLKTMSHEQIIQKIMSITDQIQSCLEKSLA